MYAKRMIITGAVMVAAAGAILAVALLMLGDEARLAAEARPWDGDPSAAPHAGTLVLVEGRVSERNRVLVHDFVDGAREYLPAKGSWTIAEAYRQPVIADLPGGAVILNAERICTGAAVNNVLDTGEKNEAGQRIRHIGLRRGDPITAIGTLAAPAPPSLTVMHWYAGTRADYGRAIASGRRGSLVFFAVLTALGAALVIAGLVQRRRA